MAGQPKSIHPMLFQAPHMSEQHLPDGMVLTPAGVRPEEMLNADRIATRDTDNRMASDMTLWVGDKEVAQITRNDQSIPFAHVFRALPENMGFREDPRSANGSERRNELLVDGMLQGVVRHDTDSGKITEVEFLGPRAARAFHNAEHKATSLYAKEGFSLPRSMGIQFEVDDPELRKRVMGELASASQKIERYGDRWISADELPPRIERPDARLSTEDYAKAYFDRLDESQLGSKPAELGQGKWFAQDREAAFLMAVEKAGAIEVGKQKAIVKEGDFVMSYPGQDGNIEYARVPKDLVSETKEGGFRPLPVAPDASMEDARRSAKMTFEIKRAINERQGRAGE